MDLGKKTVRDIFKKKIGEKNTEEILAKVNEAYENGKRGEELTSLFKQALMDKGLDTSDSSYGCVIAFA